jgi:hypothetical protein
LCETCPSGADCSTVGTAYWNVKTLPGYWRPNNRTETPFYMCQFREFCLGSQAVGSSSNPDDWSLSASQCAGDLSGIFCSSCRPGFKREAGGKCAPCPTSSVSWVLVILIAFVIILAFWIQFYIILKDDKNVMNQLNEECDHKLEESQLWQDSAELDLDQESELEENGAEGGESVSNADHSSSSGSSESSATNSSSVSDSSDESSETGSSSSSETGSSSATSDEGSSDTTTDATTTDTETETETETEDEAKTGKESASESDSPIDRYFTAHQRSDQTDPRALNPYAYTAGNMLLDMDQQRVHVTEQFSGISPPTAPPSFMFKLKILLTFLQIVTNVASSIEIQWPSVFKSFLLYFNVVNFDFILSDVTSSDCFQDVTYYRKYLIIVLVPIIILVTMMIFYVIPLYFQCFCWRYQSIRAIMLSKIRAWKIFLYLLFLLYPGVSSTVLRLYVCTEVDGARYLWTDLRVSCDTDTYATYSKASVPAIFVYPIGIPVFFFTLLYSNRHAFDTPRIRAQLGFLYLSYYRHLWFWEIIDSLHKLAITSILALFPRLAQIPTGMSILMAYLIACVYLKPFQVPSDHFLHILSLIEIYLLLLAGYVVQSASDVTRSYSSTDDVTISVALIFAVVIFFSIFLILALVAVYGSVLKLFRRMLLKREAQRRKAARTVIKRNVIVPAPGAAAASNVNASVNAAPLGIVPPVEQ